MNIFTNECICQKYLNIQIYSNILYTLPYSYIKSEQEITVLVGLGSLKLLGQHLLVTQKIKKYQEPFFEKSTQQRNTVFSGGK